MMRTNPPIACSLTSSEFQARFAEMQTLGAEALVAARRDSAILTMRFRGDDAIRGQVRQVAAAESECCGFLDIAVEEHGNEVTLRIEAPPGAEPVLDDLLDAFGSSAEAA